MYFGACTKPIYISMTALTNSWVLLNIIKHLDDRKFGLFDEAVKAKRVWTISIRTSITEDFLSYLNELLTKFCLYFIRYILTKYL